MVGASLPALQTPLTSAAVLAESTRATPPPSAGSCRRRSWTRGIEPTPIAASLRSHCGRRTARFAARSRWSALNRSWVPRVRPPFGRCSGGPPARSGWRSATCSPHANVDSATHTASPQADYVVYAETVLPSGRPARIGKDEAFSELDYAIYLGKTANSRPAGIEYRRRVPPRSTGVRDHAVRRFELAGCHVAYNAARRGTAPRGCGGFSAFWGSSLPSVPPHSLGGFRVGAKSQSHLPPRTRSSTPSNARLRRRCSTVCLPKPFRRSRASSSARGT